MRILVVDDNQDGARTMATLLTLLGHEARVYHNGGTAVREAALVRPHAVLLDIGMSGIDGYETCRVLRNLLPGPLLIVAVTGLDSEAAQRLAHEAGFDHFLTKPVDWKTLERLLNGASTVSSGEDQGA